MRFKVIYAELPDISVNLELKSPPVQDSTVEIVKFREIILALALPEGLEAAVDSLVVESS